MNEKINDYLDYINDVKHDIEYFEQLKKLYQYNHLNYPELTEEMADYLQGQIVHCHLMVREGYGKLNNLNKLNKLYKKGGMIEMEKLEIMQWGEKRSVVYCVNTKTGKSKILLIDNDYLMLLDDLGVIE